LEQRHLDLERGWLNYPRPKTGVARRARLWPETIAAIKDAVTARPRPKSNDDKSLVFITKRGFRWAKATRDNPISKEVAKLLDELSIERRGRNFYALRHTLETIGGG